MASQLAPWFLLGALLVGLVFYAVVSARRQGASKGDIDDANARAEYNRILADRRVAKNLEELRARARRRRERL